MELTFKMTMDPWAMDVERTVRSRGPDKAQLIGSIQWHNEPRFVPNLRLNAGISLTEIGEIQARLLKESR